MKRNFILTLLLTALTGSAYAQAEMEAYNLSSYDLKGTARSVGMGGAFGALGGDVSGIVINPAGIGVYKSSEIVTTLNFNSSTTSTNLSGTKTDDKKFKFLFDNIAVVGVFPVNSDAVPLVNFGFAYNRLKTFDRSIKMNGGNQSYSLTEVMASLANKSPQGVLTESYDSDANWLSILGYGSYLIDNKGQSGKFESLFKGQFDNSLLMREKGGIDSYDFSAGTTISDIVSLGATLTVTDINYTLYTDYTENLLGFGTSNRFSLENHLKTEGSGWQVKVGAIVKPIRELRIGVSYHSPTWYNMTDYFYAEVNNGKEYAYTPDIDNFADYKFRSPDKWTLSLAGIIGKMAIISADYELTNYGNMNYKDINDRPFTDTNGYISQDFKSSSSVRVGAEVRFTPQITGRAGFSWTESPLKGELANGEITAETVGTNHAYILPKDTYNITYGLGYKFTPNFYTDVAFVMKNQKADLYAFGEADKAELKNNAFTGLLTFGYKF